MLVAPRSLARWAFAAGALVAPPAPGAFQETGGVPKAGEPAPDFALPDQDGRIVTRESLLGKRVVLAFYPKDFTGG